jgi:hypothetical protein
MNKPLSEASSKSKLFELLIGASSIYFSYILYGILAEKM